MANKAIFGLVLLCLLSTAYSQTALQCPLANFLADARVCANNVCSINSVTLAVICGVTTLGLSSLNLVLTSSTNASTTINFDASASALAFTGLSVGGSASTTATVNIPSALTITGNLALAANAVVNVAQASVVKVNGNVQVAAGATLNVVGNVTTSAATTISGTLRLGGSVVQSSAQTAWYVATTTSVSFSGTAAAQAAIVGNGGIDGSVVVTGNVTVAAGNSPGTVYVNGDLSMSSTTTLEIDVDSSSSFDRLIIKGRFNRDGILHADFEGGFVPNSNQEFIFASHSSASGSFNVARGNFDKTLNQVHPKYGTLSSSFVYGSASSVSLSIALISLCIAALVF